MKASQRLKPILDCWVVDDVLAAWLLKWVDEQVDAERLSCVNECIEVSKECVSLRDGAIVSSQRIMKRG